MGDVPLWHDRVPTCIVARTRAKYASLGRDANETIRSDHPGRAVQTQWPCQVNRMDSHAAA